MVRWNRRRREADSVERFPGHHARGGGAIGSVLSGFPAGAEGCFPGRKATNYGSGATGCGGGGGGAGAGGPGEDSQVLHTQTQNDDYQDENGNYEHAGNGGPGVVSDITGEALSYGDGGGGGARRSDYKHGGAGGLGGGGAGSAGSDGTVGTATTCLGNGGEGLAFDIAGESRFYAGGGAAGYTSSANGRGNHGVGGSGVGGDGEVSLSSSYRRAWGQPGLDGTGSGGGGGGQSGGAGGRGGCGVLILRYLADPPGTLILVK